MQNMTGGIFLQMTLPLLSPDKFNAVLSSAIDGTIQEFLGFNTLKALQNELKTKHDISRDELPYRIRTMFDILETKFKVRGAQTMGPLIAERFYMKLGLPFHSHEAYRLVDYIEEAKTKLSYPRFQ